MAQLTLTNSSTLRAAEDLLWNMWVDIGQDGKVSGDGVNRIREDLALSAVVLPSVHEAISAAEPSDLVSKFRATASQISFTTTAFSSDSEDLVADITLNGSNLATTTAQSRVSGLGVKFQTTFFSDGLEKTPANTIGKGTGSIQVGVSYDVQALANDAQDDGEMRWTSHVQSNKNTTTEVNNGASVSVNETETRSLRGDVLLREDGSYSGKLFSMNVADSDTRSDKTGYSFSLKLDSKAGMSVDHTDSLSGTIDSLSFTKSNRSAGYSDSISYKSTGPDSLTAGALGNFFKGQATVTDVAMALFAGNDVITASGGTTTLNGYGGNDRLVGGRGNDVFEFTTALDAATNVDQIVNLKRAGSDKIRIEDSIFAGYRGAQDFVAGSAALDAQDRIIFNSATGALLYDADGSGAAGAIQFATVVGKVTVTAADIIVV